MIVGLNFDTKEFERAMRELARESDRSGFEIVTMNARTFVKSVAYNTPRATGATRAGYWPAYQALEMTGSPGTRRPYAPFKRGKVRMMVPEGKVVDKRRERGEQSFEFVNKTHYVQAGKKVYYPYIVNAKSDFFGRGAAEAAFKFGKTYEKLLRKHGKL